MSHARTTDVCHRLCYNKWGDAMLPQETNCLASIAAVPSLPV